MKGILNILKLATKYGALLMVIVDVIQYATEKIEGINVKETN